MKKTLKKILKSILTILGIAFIACTLYYTYIYYNEIRPKEKVEIEIIFIPEVICTPEKPFSVKISNNSHRIIKETTFSISVIRLGYSSRLDQYLNWKTTDKMSKPNESFKEC